MGFLLYGDNGNTEANIQTSVFIQLTTESLSLFSDVSISKGKISFWRNKIVVFHKSTDTQKEVN